MTEYKCDFSGCGVPATTQFIRAGQRRLVQEGHLCREHGSDLLLEYQRSPRPLAAGTPCEYEGGVGFDMDFLFFDDGWGQRQPLCQAYLVEVGGSRQVGVTIGPCEGYFLRLALQHYQSPRPLTHQAMGAAISSLGGRVQHVVIDKFFPDQQMYEAKVYIQQMAATVVVDVRPSDAIILAVVCDVPILVSKKVLATLAETER